MIIPNLILPIAISAGGLVLTAAYGINRNSKERSKAREELERKLVSYPTASAGTPSRSIPAEQKSIPTRYTQFLDYEGRVINSNDYLQFVVKGNSMQFCGINDNDLIFVKKDFNIDQLESLPTPIVIRRDNAPSIETQYKVRRAWGLCSIETCEEFVAKMVRSEEFRKIIGVIKYFDGEDALLEDFKVQRLDKYRKKYLIDNMPSEEYNQVIVSTTFHTDEKKIRFSIHPVSDVIGVVCASFTVGKVMS